MNLNEALDIALREPKKPNRGKALKRCEEILKETVRRVELSAITQVEMLVNDAKEQIESEKLYLFECDQAYMDRLVIYNDRDRIIQETEKCVKGDEILEYMLSVVFEGFSTISIATAGLKKRGFNCKGREALELLEAKLSRIEYDTKHIKAEKVVKDELAELDEVIELFEKKTQAIKKAKMNAMKRTEKMESLFAKIRGSYLYTELKKEQNRNTKINENYRMLKKLEDRRKSLPDPLANIGNKTSGNNMGHALFEKYNERIADIEREIAKEEYNSKRLKALLSVRGTEQTDSLVMLLSAIDDLEDFYTDPMTSLMTFLERLESFESIVKTAYTCGAFAE